MESFDEIYNVGEELREELDKEIIICSAASGKVKTKKVGKGKKVKISAMATDGSNKKAVINIKIK